MTTYRLEQLQRTAAFFTIALLMAGAFALLLQPQKSFAVNTQCSDGIDNDGDGHTDYPNDSGCTSLSDNSEDTSSDSSTPDFQVRITDGKTTVSQSQSLTYTITVTNLGSSSSLQDVRVTVAPDLTVTDVSGDGQFSSQSVTWRSVRFYPDEDQTFWFTAKVRRQVDNGVDIVNRVRVGDSSASDTTRTSGSISTTYNNGTTSNSTNSVLFRMTPSQTEAVPGARITYTLYVRNNLDQTISDATVRTTFDPSYLTIIDQGNANLSGSSQLTWDIPTLDPSESWTDSFTLRVQGGTPVGANLQTTATIYGSDVRTLSREVTLQRTGIIGYLPTTGIGMDVIYLLASSGLLLLPALLLRRRKA